MNLSISESRSWFCLLLLYLFFIQSCKNELNAGHEVNESLPNIIHIFADDLGYGDLGCFGADDIKTPNIDRLANEGLKFTSFYSASPICSPSRAALMTGRLPQRMGINGVFFPESFTGMSPEEFTIAELLKKKGYNTGIVGKWHLGHMYQYLPLQQGFDSYFGIPYSNDMESVVYIRNNEVEEFNVDQRYTTKRYTEEAIDFLDQQDDAPFFLYVAHNMPHVPIYASEDFIGTSERGLYGDVVQELDWSVGELLKQLEKMNKLENTLVIFSSDNGPWLVMEDHGGSAGMLREGKQFTFEGGMRVPTLAMWKGTIKANSVYENIASQLDWFPTFAELTGSSLPNDKPIDGRSLAKVLIDAGERNDQAFIYFDNQKLECFRDEKWKVKLPFSGHQQTLWRKGVPAHDTLLIDLVNDPGENHNLYEEHKEIAIELIGKMNQRYQEMQPLPKSLVIRSEADHAHFEYLKEKAKSSEE